MSGAAGSFSLFVHLRALPAWLAMSRPERDRMVAEHAGPVLARFPGARVRWFDAEAFTARCSDILMLENLDARTASHLMEGLRDTPFFSVPWFELVDVFPALEDGFRDYESA